MNSQIEKYKCLLLNADFTPLRIVDWRRSIRWTIKEYGYYPIEIVEFYKNQYIQGVGKIYPIPSVARTTQYLNLYNKPLNFSRKNVYIRDNYTCQYCGKKYSVSELTYDHVIPKSKFSGKKNQCTNWNNVVTACVPCNAKKGNKTPQEANMMPINHPIRPKYSPEYLPWLKDLSIIDGYHDLISAYSLYINK